MKITLMLKDEAVNKWQLYPDLQQTKISNSLKKDGTNQMQTVEMEIKDKNLINKIKNGSFISMSCTCAKNDCSFMPASMTKASCQDKCGDQSCNGNCLSKSQKPPKWTSVYPQGTPEGDEEQKFFIALSRSKYDWRSVAAIAKEAKLSEKRVEEIILKYYDSNMVLQNPSNEDIWAYWETVLHLLPKIKDTVANTDKKVRINKALH